MKLTINVTAYDIADGKPDNCYACPVALAVARAVTGRVYVYSTEIVIDGIDLFCISLPSEIRQFIREFDSAYGGPGGNRIAAPHLTPFSFDIEIDQKHIRLA